MNYLIYVYFWFLEHCITVSASKRLFYKILLIFHANLSSFIQMQAWTNIILKSALSYELKLTSITAHRYCAVNEIIVRNGTSCEKCPQFSWPDVETATYCQEIPLTHYEWSSPVTLVVTVVSGAGVLLCIATTIYFLTHRKVRLIKATGIELSLLGLLGNISFYFA